MKSYKRKHSGKEFQLPRTRWLHNGAGSLSRMMSRRAGAARKYSAVTVLSKDGMIVFLALWWNIGS